MKPIYKEFAMALVMGLILPGIVLQFAVDERREEPPPAPTEAVVAPSHSQRKITMNLRTGENVQQMDLDEYLVGVLLGEMPADFESEAKKAQAVVARTFTMKAATTGGKHGDGSVCTDSACCQAYTTVEDYLARGGSREAVESAKKAVEATSGYVLTYGGELIEATYFSCSGGTTEDAVAVWGTDFPYLQSTASPGEERAAHYTDTVHITAEQFGDSLGLTGNPENWLGTATYTSGGGVATMKIGGKEFLGTELRKLLNLRSTAFTISQDGGGFTIVTRGFGHRVGMSQYGADAMAASGSGFEEILKHYYEGTELTLWEN